MMKPLNTNPDPNTRFEERQTPWRKNKCRKFMHERRRGSWERCQTPSMASDPESSDPDSIELGGSFRPAP